MIIDITRRMFLVLTCVVLAISSAPVFTAEWEKVESVDALARELGVWDETDGPRVRVHLRRAGGVWVDPRSGDVYVMIAGRPIFRSTDQGETWRQWGPDWLTGQTNMATGIGIHHPYRGRMLLFRKHGVSGLTLDDGETWQRLPNELVHGDTDWESDVPSVFISHGDHGANNMSIDGGETWHRNGTIGRTGNIGFFHLGLIDGETMLVASGARGRDAVRVDLVTGTIDDQPVTVTPREIENRELAVTDAQHHSFQGIYTTTNILGPWDYAGDFTKISDLTPIAPNPIHWDNGRMYWAGVEGLLVSDDGLEWRVHSDGVKNVLWVMFGTTEQDILVVDRSKTPFLTSDGGKTWRQVAPAFDIRHRFGVSAFGWDPINRLIYVSQLAGSLYRIRYEAELATPPG